MSDLGNKEIMAENIRYYMDINQIDRNKLCSDLGIKYTTLCDWLNGKTYPRIDKIEMMANYFCIQKADLVENRRTRHVVNSLMTAEEKKLNTTYLIDDGTMQLVIEIFNKDRVLFDVYKSDDRDRLVAYAKKLQSLHDMENGEN